MGGQLPQGPPWRRPRWGEARKNCVINQARSKNYSAFFIFWTKNAVNSWEQLLISDPERRSVLSRGRIEQGSRRSREPPGSLFYSSALHRAPGTAKARTQCQRWRFSAKNSRSSCPASSAKSPLRAETSWSKPGNCSRFSKEPQAPRRGSSAA